MRYLLPGKKSTLLILLLGVACAGLIGWLPRTAEAWGGCQFVQMYTNRYYSDATYTQQVGICTYNCQAPQGACWGQFTEFVVYEEGDICSTCTR